MKKYLLALIFSLFLPTLANIATVSAQGINPTPTGLETSLTTPNSTPTFIQNTISYTYTRSGQLATIKNEHGTTTYTYNNRDRLISITQPYATIVAANGTSSAGNTVTITYTYDDVGNKTSVTVKANLNANNLSNPTNAANPFNTAARTTTYTYDALDRVQTITDWNNQTTSYQYHPNSNNRSTATHPTGLQTSYSYDALDRLTKIEVKRISDNVIIQTIDYGTINPNGQKAKQQISYPTLAPIEASYANSNVSYEYDNLNRLKQSLENGAASLSTSAIYNYFEVGNLNTGIISPNGVFTNTNGTLGPINTQYDNLDRLASATIHGNAETYRYDLAGNLIHKGNNQQHRFDTLNRLTDTRTFVPPPAAGTYTGTPARINYQYDADGHRISRAKTNVGSIAIISAPQASLPHDITHYTIDKTADYPHVMEERDGNGTLIAAYVLSPSGERIGEDRNMAHRQNGGSNTGTTASTSFNVQRFIYHVDHLGTTRMVTDSTRAIDSTWRYTDYGQVIYKTGAHPTSYLYAGEHQDADNGLIYLRARYYNPGMARFISADSYEGDLDEPSSLNRYSYAANDPINKTDPSGETNLSEQGATANTNGTLGSLAQPSVNLYIRKFLVGDPKRGDFGLIGELVLDACLGAVDKVVNDKNYKTANKQKKGTAAHSLLKTEIEALNRWLVRGSITRKVQIEAEISRDKNTKPATYGAKDSLRIDIVVKYEGKPFVLLDLKTGAGVQQGFGTDGFSRSKRAQYTRRFKARVYTIGVAIP